MRPMEMSEIRDLALFRKMSDDSFAELMRAAYVQTFPPQIQLIEQGAQADFLHVVIDGMVELLATWNRHDTTMALVRPVSTFILAATIRAAPNLMAARTLVRTQVVMIPSQDVRAVFDRDNDFARAVVAELAQRYRGMVKAGKDTKLRGGLERLANFLLAESRLQGGAERITLPVEKRRLAALLGMRPENLSRAFRGLQAYGVGVDGAEVTLHDPADLSRLAKPDPLIDDPES